MAGLSYPMAGDWAGYINAQGGPFVRRAALIARLWYAPEEKRNAFGESVTRIKGVFSPCAVITEPIVTRLRTWKIVKKLTKEIDVCGANAPPWSSVNNCTDTEYHYLSSALKSRGFSGSDYEIAVLKRGSSLGFHGDRRLILHQGRLEERAAPPQSAPWPGWC